MDLILYRELLRTLDKDITLRHDVDISIDAAFEMSRIDLEESFNSNWYFRCDSLYYNITGSNYLKILDMWGKGHKIGAHISCSNLHELHSKLIACETYLDLHKENRCFTFHINDDFTKSCTAPEYFGWRNDNLIPNGYVSDSRGVFPVIPDGFKGVLNIHPEWWVYPGATPKDKIQYYFNRQRDKCLKEILQD